MIRTGLYLSQQHLSLLGSLYHLNHLYHPNNLYHPNHCITSNPRGTITINSNTTAAVEGNRSYHLNPGNNAYAAVYKLL